MKKLITITLALCIFAAPVYAVESHGLSVGDQAPDFEAPNYKGEMVKLSEQYADGPVILIFYRGGWCVYCNLQLQSYQSQIEDFTSRGAKIIAVSVDKQEKAAKTVEEKELGFEVVSNPDASLLELYNVIYKVPEDLRQTYLEKYNINLKESSGRDDGVIAVSATYVINESGKIIFAHSDEDYTVRKNPDEILKVLDNRTDG